MAPSEMTFGEAMTVLFGGLDRQGPGDDDFTRQILSRLPQLSKAPKIADIGCGTGAAAMLLAAHYQSEIICLDQSKGFIEALGNRARTLGLSDFITPVIGDMGAMDRDMADLDLLWSEGAAYNLTFAGALKCWHPFLKTGGLAVISELSWFDENASDESRQFWEAAYPTMALESANEQTAAGLGYEVLFTKRLPAVAWWQNYYSPLLDRAEALIDAAPPALVEAIQETRQEVDVYRDGSDHFGYTFYGLRTV